MKPRTPNPTQDTIAIPHQVRGIILYYQSEGLGTDYGSSWVRELIWAFLPGEELFAPAAAPADPRGNFEEREPKQF